MTRRPPAQLPDAGIPSNAVDRANAGITAGLQAELIRLLTGLTPALQAISWVPPLRKLKRRMEIDN